MSAVNAMTVEWQRLGVLANCLTIARQGETIPESLQTSLSDLQSQLVQTRQQPIWHNLINEKGLNTLDQDILVCVLAPNAEPRLGWMFQQMQSGNVTPFPTPAFIHELYFMAHGEGEFLSSRLDAASPLLRSGLLESSANDFYAPIRPTQQANIALLGWSGSATQTPPGTIEITDDAPWSDLVLPEYCIHALREFMLWTTHREQVVNEWGGKSTGGPVALFSGPSGTGKTFSALVVARALGWPLYRVDLGMLVSKYIGETEKNVNKLFDAAHAQPMVLLFDEAESLFGKRGEVRDVRDRFANMEISHLLSRIENHQGPCILTTNLRQNLDPAFARRFQVVLEFPRPEPQARVQLWQKHLPPRAPYEKNINVDILGQELKLTGGQIRNTALHAAFLAAGEKSPIGMKHIARAVWTEMAKTGKEVTLTSLGGLAEYIQQEQSSHVAY